MEVRALQPGDRAAWEPLWQGYLRFYDTELPDDLTDLTWRRLLDDAEPMGALGAFAGANLVGISHHVLHRSTWSPTTYCYLEDLFVSPESRGAGVARTLIEATASVAVEAGATKLYWQTHRSNDRARRLYDQVATHEGFLVYERDLG